MLIKEQRYQTVSLNCLSLEAQHKIQTFQCLATPVYLEYLAQKHFSFIAGCHHVCSDSDC